MIRFEKVPFDEYLRCRQKMDSSLLDTEIYEEYQAIKLPTRATTGSAGYDFYTPFTVTLNSPETFAPGSESGMFNYITMPLGIRFVTDRKDIVLLITPRSGLGFKYSTRLANSLGVIDSDYQNSDNFGHIQLKITCEKSVTVEAGKAIVQGIIVPYITVDSEDCDNMSERNGGFGSTQR